MSGGELSRLDRVLRVKGEVLPMLDEGEVLDIVVGPGLQGRDGDLRFVPAAHEAAGLVVRVAGVEVGDGQ